MSEKDSKSEKVQRLAEETFHAREEIVAQEVITALYEKQVKLAQRAAKAAGEAFDMANELAADGDPYKQQAASLLKSSVLHGISAIQDVATGQLTTENGEEALQGDPFVENSKPSKKSLPEKPSSSNGQTKALPKPNGDQPEKRGPGRPRKS